MSPADRIHEQNEQDPGRVVHTRQEAGPSDFLAADPALHIIQLNMEGLSAAKRFIIRDISERHSVNVICLQETHVDIDWASCFSVSGFDLISYTLLAKYGCVLYTRNDLGRRQANGLLQGSLLALTLSVTVSEIECTLTDSQYCQILSAVASETQHIQDCDKCFPPA